MFLLTSDTAPTAANVRPIAEVEREICELAAHINAATARWLSLVGEFDRRNGHEAFGFVSCATWLAWRCSITPRAAREQLRVARRLGELPRIAAAFGRGNLSYSKARALTRAATPEMEAELLELAQEATAAQLERILSGYRQALEPDACSSAMERRHVATRWEDDGSLSIRASLPAEEGALLLKALDLAREAIRRQRNEGEGEAGSEGGHLPAPDRADALLALVETAIAGGVREAGGGDRHQVVVHVDLDALKGGRGDGSASLEDGVALPRATARRLACEASIVSLIERDGEPISVGRKTRSIPPALARALRSRDRGCRFPGCDRDRFVDAHHIEHWANGGETSMDNLIQLCRHHHRLVHEGGFTVSHERGGVTFRTPGGRVLPEVPLGRRGSAEACIGASRPNGGGPVDSEAAAPGSWGEPVDYDLATFVLCDLHERRMSRDPYSVA